MKQKQLSISNSYFCFHHRQHIHVRDLIFTDITIQWYHWSSSPSWYQLHDTSSPACTITSPSLSLTPSSLLAPISLSDVVLSWPQQRVSLPRPQPRVSLPRPRPRVSRPLPRRSLNQPVHTDSVLTISKRHYFSHRLCFDSCLFLHTILCASDVTLNLLCSGNNHLLLQGEIQFCLYCGKCWRE